MSTKKIITTSAAETQQVAHDLAHEICASQLKNSAVILALSGDLGAGKTTFVQGFARALGITEMVNSPTFIIMKRFMVHDAQFKNFYHFDCYRLDHAEDIMDLGFAEIISNPENIVIIEWPEKIANIVPAENIISLNFEHGQGDTRTLTVNTQKYILNPEPKQLTQGDS